MTIARRGLKVKVMGQANAVCPTSTGDSFLLVTDCSLMQYPFRDKNKIGLVGTGD